MTNNSTVTSLVQTLADQLCEKVRQKASANPRTYGFEYEFLPDRILDRTDLRQITSCLPQWGFYEHDGLFFSDFGLGINFEPGGQIEYHSPPLLPDDSEKFYRSLAAIEKTNLAIREALGIDYIGTGYFPGRDEAPLCLDNPRYHLLHERLKTTGTRGMEMMKGTASIHLHAVIRDYRELVPIYLHMAHQMRPSRTFGMKAEREDIWNNTDPGRCGLPYENITPDSPPRALIEEFTRVAVLAEVLGRDIPFWQTPDTDFDSFLSHLTTIFTDIRLNIKGPTLELRTPDSVPPPVFESMWERFVQQMTTITGEVPSS